MPLTKQELFCPRPFTELTVGPHAYYLCCPGWGDFEIALHPADVEEIWNSKKVQDIRASILDGSFSHCTSCPNLIQILYSSKPKFGPVLSKEMAAEHPFYSEVMNKNLVVLDRSPVEISMAANRTCNLACPSCRTKVVRDKTPYYDIELVKSFLAQDDCTLETLWVSGSGDPLFNPDYREFLNSVTKEEYPNLNIHVQTNGLFAKKYLPEILEKGVVRSVNVSVDAATKETYEKLRRGAKWERLLENLEYLSEAPGFFSINMVGQKDNWREMEAFIEMGKRYKSQGVWFSAMNLNCVSDTAGKNTILDHAIHYPQHPEHQQFVAMLKQLYIKYKNHIDHIEDPPLPSVRLGQFHGLAVD